jgi:signal transduction histidine kinase/DNA-binding response OmpR family regulator
MVRFDCLDRSRGLWSDSLHQILADDFDRLWFNSNQGVFTVARGDLVETLEGRRATVYPQAFTARDGLPSSEGNGGVQDAGVSLRDGRIAFPSQGGVALFNPYLPDPPHSGARIAIETIQLPDGRLLQPAARMPLPLGERTLHIGFTGLSDDLVQPLYFRYRLEPDAPWIELTTQRQIILDRLTPGPHRMELVALSADGRAGPVSTIGFDVPPWPHETRAFRFGVPMALALAVALGWHRQRRAATLRQIALEHTVAQRTRELRAQQDATAQALETVSRQRNEIEALATAKSRFFANISHELRTPLSLIAGPVQDMARGSMPSGELVGAMLNQTRRLRRLIDELLDLERIDAGALQLKRSDFDLVQLLQQQTADMAGMARRAGLALALDARATSLPCHGDAEQLARVVANLVGNALKFTPRGGRVRVRTVHDDRRIGFRVDDSGPGIDAQWRERIFDRFQLTGNATLRAQEGTGIGLALCNELVRLHDGGIEAGDSDLGGACFTVWLPAHARGSTAPLVGFEPDAREDAPATTASADERPPSTPADPDDGSQRPLLLVIEDQDDLRLYLAELLAGDYRVATACNGEEALARIPSLLPDAIVSDVVMPERDGLSLVAALRANGDLAGIPVLLLTARTGVDDQVTGLATGADHYLTKPFDSQVLRAHVAAMLATRLRLQRLLQCAPSSPAPSSSRRPLAQRIDEALQGLAHQPETSVAELAHATHVSERSLRRHCQELFGMTPLERLRQHRLIRARGLLEQGAGTVSEIAYAVGYGNLAAFSRAYREHFGVAPSTHLGRKASTSPCGRGTEAHPGIQ